MEKRNKTKRLDGGRMKDLLIMGVFILFLYIFYRIVMKQPILPGKQKNNHTQHKTEVGRNKKKRKHEVQIEEEPKLFQELFSDIKDISHHMIRFNDDSFTLIGEVEPVNYFLKSQDEQEQIDVAFETWLASNSYHVAFYLQNRFIDLSEPIEDMQKSMMNSEDLNEAALSYGRSMIEDLQNWQSIAPRYETKRYVLFTHKIKVHELTADSNEELEEKIVDKAFAELMRRLNNAKSQLRRAGIKVDLLPTEGIYDLLYHTFNRRKAVKNRFKDIVVNEKNAMYVTADQSDERIEAVKEGIEEYEQAEKEAVATTN